MENSITYHSLPDSCASIVVAIVAVVVAVDGVVLVATVVLVALVAVVSRKTCKYSHNCFTF